MRNLHDNYTYEMYANSEKQYPSVKNSVQTTVKNGIQTNVKNSIQTNVNPKAMTSTKNFSDNRS